MYKDNDQSYEHSSHNMLPITSKSGRSETETEWRMRHADSGSRHGGSGNLNYRSSRRHRSWICHDKKRRHGAMKFGRDGRNDDDSRHKVVQRRRRPRQRFATFTERQRSWSRTTVDDKTARVLIPLHIVALVGELSNILCVFSKFNEKCKGENWLPGNCVVLNLQNRAFAIYYVLYYYIIFVYAQSGGLIYCIEWLRNEWQHVQLQTVE